MSRDAQFEAQGFAYYVDRIRSGERDVYAASRVFERSYGLPPDEAKTLLRQCALILVEADPWFLATGMTMFLGDALRISDLERLTPLVGRGIPAGAAAYLRATLWFHGVRHKPPRAAVEKALGFLAKVPRASRQVGWHEMTVGCHERLCDWRAYARTFPRLFAATDPAWRAHPLRDMLGNAAEQRDWLLYDRWRKEWDALPANRHSCECAKNEIGTLDGLRAVAARNWDAIPTYLAAAADVRGCPHLNSAGFRLDLVRVLVPKRKSLDACRAYLDRAAMFAGRSKELATLRRALDKTIGK